MKEDLAAGICSTSHGAWAWVVLLILFFFFVVVVIFGMG